MSNLFPQRSNLPAVMNLLDRLIDAKPLKLSNNHVSEVAKASLGICTVTLYARSLICCTSCNRPGRGAA
jgi:hypothetical protein